MPQLASDPPNSNAAGSSYRPRTPSSVHCDARFSNHRCSLPSIWISSPRHARRAAGEAVVHGITIVIEPISLRDMPGYLLNRQSEAETARRRICVGCVRCGKEVRVGCVMAGRQLGNWLHDMR
ncbi:Hydroxypyruvate isomerase (EC 5.3.1.22) [Mycetohabitans rhizoxinica HKI 454]|uniref:Hydroxypyruvate isomerase n=1 Tax=Mycetohabitans rhizoxinica (strain DSM 19002 / CIP 109453 / HKI 454) TaxID=882378 RepID=E5AQ41_MYCRK|nr:Hydroxypyruvate isomerase (EC 5.3.1.22) [Mycetohabitans rhizoxinica HKI 454]